MGKLGLIGGCLSDRCAMRDCGQLVDFVSMQFWLPVQFWCGWASYGDIFLAGSEEAE